MDERTVEKHSKIFQTYYEETYLAWRELIQVLNTDKM